MFNQAPSKRSFLLAVAYIALARPLVRLGPIGGVSGRLVMLFVGIGVIAALTIVIGVAIPYGRWQSAAKAHRDVVLKIKLIQIRLDTLARLGAINKTDPNLLEQEAAPLRHDAAQLQEKADKMAIEIERLAALGRVYEWQSKGRYSDSY